jgi:hypothetical protein
MTAVPIVTRNTDVSTGASLCRNLVFSAAAVGGKVRRVCRTVSFPRRGRRRSAIIRTLAGGDATAWLATLKPSGGDRSSFSMVISLPKRGLALKYLQV